MEDNKKAEVVKGMFSNCIFQSSVVVGIAESGSEVFYEKQIEAKKEQGDCSDKIASKEMMSRAARITLDGGYWKSQRSWSVTFLVYCIWGYKGSINDFIAEVTNWPDGVAERMICNRDAVVKLKNMYHFTKSITEWRKNGVPEQYCILGEQLDKELDKLLVEGI